MTAKHNEPRGHPTGGPNFGRGLRAWARLAVIVAMLLAAVPPVPSAAQSAYTIYTVQLGDNLTRIAKRFHTTVEAIQALNNLKTTVILEGQTLKLPPGAALVVAPPKAPANPARLVLATTTSTADSGLLAAILPYFEAREAISVHIIAVGTGQALAIGGRGDADVLLVHARAQEDKFVADGLGLDRRDVMYNDFVVVGPPADRARIRHLQLAKEAFARIAASGSPFASRGDNSGTHTREEQLWAAAGYRPASGVNGYVSLGQGMGETLIFADETGAYTLTDRGTWLSQKGRLPNLTLLVGGPSVSGNPDPALLNPYGVVAVNPARFPGVNYPRARRFIEWLTSLSIQRRIYEFGRDLYGESLFYPAAQAP